MSRILVADDLPDNRLLIEIYLEESSHILTFVGDGAAAVQRFRDAVFDLILMDVQMPGMDGLAAARAIRAIERERGDEPVPIIAVTAGSCADEFERSREAGCTAHLSKPITSSDLITAVQKYTSCNPRQTSKRDLSQVAPARKVFEIPEGLKALRLDYISNQRLACETIEHLVAARDFKRIHAMAHDMKGTGSAYGFAELTEFGVALEASADGADVAALVSKVGELRRYLTQVNLASAS